MGTRVLLATSLRPELGVSGNDNGLPVVDSRHVDVVESTICELASSHGQLIVACADHDYESIRRIVTHAQLRGDDFQVAIETIGGTPLAIGVIASLADEIGGQTDVDAQAAQFAALDYLREHVWSAAWLPSVSQLRNPAPSVLQHVRSWLPHSGFLAVDGSDAHVDWAPKAPLSTVPLLEGFALIRSPSEAPAWVAAAVEDAIRPESVSEVIPVRDSIDSFGSRQVAEFVAIPADFHDRSRPRHETVSSCAACGVRHARPFCPYCKMATANLQGVNQ